VRKLLNGAQSADLARELTALPLGRRLADPTGTYEVYYYEQGGWHGTPNVRLRSRLGSHCLAASYAGPTV